MTATHLFRETKFVAAPLSAVEVDGSFSGYASLFGRVDLGRDRVLPGAFQRSLAQRGVSGIRMLWQHDPAQPIGVWTAIAEDSRGLFVRGRLELSVSQAKEAHALMRQGAIDGLSIGFRTAKARADKTTGIRDLAEVDLWEISLVTFPMLPEARIAQVKGRIAHLPSLTRTIRRAAQNLRHSINR